jgi:predicted acylesterase/phospholipase RssA
MAYPSTDSRLDPAKYTKLRQRVSDPDTRFIVSLGSGAMLALASSLSILRFLEELELAGHIDEVWGSSSGAMAGALWCSGTPVERVLTMLRGLRRRDLVDVAWGHILKGLFTRKWDLDVADGLLNGRKLLGRVGRLLRVGGVEDCPVPLRILLAHDDGTARLKVVRCGDLVDAVRCSVAMQGVFRPGRFEGERYVDPTMLEKTPLPSVIADHHANHPGEKLLILAAFHGYHGQRKPIKGLMSRLFFFKEVLQYQVFLAHLSQAARHDDVEVVVYSPCIHDVDTLAVEQADWIFAEVRRQMTVRLDDRFIDADIHEADPDVWVPNWCPERLLGERHSD